MIDFPFLLMFAEREKNGSSDPFISTTSKTKHPESTIVRFLSRLQSPPAVFISKWAKLIAASVEIIAFKLYNPPPPPTDLHDTPLTQGIQVLTWLESIKQSLSTIEVHA